MTTVEAEITAMVAEAFDATIPRKRAVVRSQTVAPMDAETGEAVVTPTDAECWALLDSGGLRGFGGGTIQDTLSIEQKGRTPWLLQGLLVQPRGGHELVIEGLGVTDTFTHDGSTRTGKAFTLTADGQDQSAGVGALWKVLA